MRKYRGRKVNLPVVAVVTLLCAAGLTLFFLFWEPDETPVAPPPPIEKDDFDAKAYYNALADDFLRSLPDDKVPMVRLIDDTNHYVFYYEKSSTPSCYVYDLERRTTSVLFGGENGFYIDTKLLIVGAIEDWRLAGRLLVFVARNRAPERTYPTATVTFYVDIYTRQLTLVDYGANAYFPDDSHVVIYRAKYLYQGMFAPDDVYAKTPVSYRIL